MSKVNQMQMQDTQDEWDALDWEFGIEFVFADSADAHDPCFVVMPGGAALSLNHHDGEGVDIARAKWIVDACNDKLRRIRDELEWRTPPHD